MDFEKGYRPVCEVCGPIGLPTTPDVDVFEHRQYARRVGQQHIVEEHREGNVAVEIEEKDVE